MYYEETLPITVLYIDDEASNLQAFAAVFRREFEVLTAQSAREGLEILAEKKVHVILCDQRMPEVTGVEFFEMILQRFPQPIRILITGYADINVVIDAINKGEVYKYLTKPWNDDDIRNFIIKAHEVYTLREENERLLQQVKENKEKLKAFGIDIHDIGD